jgi:hypothetical protein
MSEFKWRNVTEFATIPDNTPLDDVINIMGDQNPIGVTKNSDGNITGIIEFEDVVNALQQAKSSGYDKSLIDLANISQPLLTKKLDGPSSATSRVQMIQASLLQQGNKGLAQTYDGKIVNLLIFDINRDDLPSDPREMVKVLEDTSTGALATIDVSREVRCGICGRINFIDFYDRDNPPCCIRGDHIFSPIGS